MKWKDIDFKNGIKNIRGVLIYGVDAGLISEYVDKAIKTKQIDKDSLINVSAKVFEEKEEAIYSEACSVSMFGGDKMVVITDAGDSDAKRISEFINHPSLAATVIVTGGELKAGGGLRTLFENGANFASMACYHDSVTSLTAFIQQGLFGLGVKEIRPDAMSYMLGNMGMDRGITKGFLEKIAIYVNETKIVTLQDAEDCLPDTGFTETDEFLTSLASGQPKKTMHALDRLFYTNGEKLVPMLTRRLISYFNSVLSAVVDGKMPRFFNDKKRNDFYGVIKIWPESELTNVLIRLNELEKQTRTKGMPVDVLLRDFALKLSLRAFKLSVNKGKK